jgi:LDH2 family malate/lactate/ureidoglycolate dehydrogenase
MAGEETMMAEEKLVNHEKLQDLVVRALTKMDVPEGDARITAGMLVHTDLRGMESHGVARLAAFYIGGIRHGAVNPHPDIQIVRESASTAVVDGDRGLGFVVGHRAMTEAIGRAEVTGAGFVSVRNSTHCGSGFNYSIMALPHDMVGISMTTGGPVMAPAGGKKPTIGINVISVAAPTGGLPFVLDMCTGVAAVGKLEIAARRREPIPEGWTIDAEGSPITDPMAYFQGGGAMLPLGSTHDLRDYKGYGLAVAIDILCSVLSGGKLSGLPEGTYNHGYGALRIDAFTPLEEFKALMDGMAAHLKATPLAPGVDRIQLAGDPEHEMEERRRAEGIPLHPIVVDSLRKMSEELEIEFDI